MSPGGSSEAPAAAVALKVPLTPVELKARRSTICVTGGTGYIAGHVIHRLLAAGHTVHATVRGEPDNAASVGHLWQLPGASGSSAASEGSSSSGSRGRAGLLKLFKADLLQPGSFDAAVAGCEYVIHCASPYILDVRPEEAQHKLIEPAVRGTENVLGSVSRTASVRRVVITSSTAAVFTGIHQQQAA